MILAIILGVVIGLATLCLILEFSHFMVFGRPIDHKTLSEFLKKNIQSYRENGIDDRGTLLYGAMTLPYIAINHSLLFKWYIDKNGVIPRWWPESKMLDDLRKEMYVGKPKNRLDIKNFV